MVENNQWAEALSLVQPLLSGLTSAVATARAEIELSADMPKRRRRAILDAAAWLREAITSIVGHCAGLVNVVNMGKRSDKTDWANHKAPELDNFQTYGEYKSAVNEWNWSLKSATVSKYLQLKYCNPGEASKFLSSFFNRAKNFDIALSCEDTGALLSSGGNNSY